MARKMSLRVSMLKAVEDFLISLQKSFLPHYTAKRLLVSF